MGVMLGHSLEDDDNNPSPGTSIVYILEDPPIDSSRQSQLHHQNERKKAYGHHILVRLQAREIKNDHNHLV